MELEKAEGRTKPSFLSYHLERLQNEHQETEEELEDIKGAAAVIYCAGADTVSTKTSLPPQYPHFPHPLPMLSAISSKHTIEKPALRW